MQRAAEQAEEALKTARQQSEKTGLDLRLARLTTDTITGMPQADIERLVKAKFTGQAGTGSAVVQQMEAWGQIYDKLPAEDPEKKGQTKEQYVSNMLRQGKAQDAAKALKAYRDAEETILTSSPAMNPSSGPASRGRVLLSLERRLPLLR